MNMMDTKTFIAIIDRDLKGQATEEEKQYLYSSRETIQRWDEILAEKIQRVQVRLTDMNQSALAEKQVFLLSNAPDAKMAWFARKVEIDNAKKGVLYFKTVVERKRIEVSHILKANISERDSIKKGYGAALYHIKMLLECGLTHEESCDFLSQFALMYLESWTKATEQSNSLDEIIRVAMREGRIQARKAS